MKRSGTAPRHCSALKEDAITGPDLLDWFTVPLAAAETLDDENRLAVGCLCQAVQAPCVKCTLLAVRRDEAVGAATAPTYTSPVNHHPPSGLDGTEVGTRLHLVGIGNPV
jgi:hypothetical protein